MRTSSKLNLPARNGGRRRTLTDAAVPVGGVCRAALISDHANRRRSDLAMTTYPVEFHRRSERNGRVAPKGRVLPNLGRASSCRPASVRHMVRGPTSERPDCSMSVLLNRSPFAAAESAKKCRLRTTRQLWLWPRHAEGRGARCRRCAQSRPRASRVGGRGALGRPDQAAHCLCFAFPGCRDPAAIGRRQIRSRSAAGWRARCDRCIRRHSQHGRTAQRPARSRRRG